MRRVLLTLLGGVGALLLWCAMGPNPSWPQIAALETGMVLFGVAVGLRGKV